MHHFDRFLRMAESQRVVDGDIGILKLRSRHLQAIESDRIRQPPNMTARRDRDRWKHGVKKGKLRGGCNLVSNAWYSTRDLSRKPCREYELPDCWVVGYSGMNVV